MIDSHIHLNSKEFYTNPEDQISEARLKGVQAIVNVSTDIESSEISIDLAQKYPNYVFATAGVHPEEVSTDIDRAVIKQLQIYYENKLVVAVGEVGLDKSYLKNKVDSNILFSYQLNWLEEQIKLAIKYDLPLILHSRETTTEMLAMLQKYSGQIKGIWHCFVEDIEVAKLVINLGLYISFTGIITYKNADKILEVVRYVPNDRYMIETDGPFLVPEPKRSQGIKPNMPWYVKDIAYKIAETKDISCEKVISDTTQNAIALFGLELRENGNLM